MRDQNYNNNMKRKKNFTLDLSLSINYQPRSQDFFFYEKFCELKNIYGKNIMVLKSENNLVTNNETLFIK